MIKHKTYIEANSFEEFKKLLDEHSKDWGTFFGLAKNNKRFWMPWLAYNVKLDEITNQKIVEEFGSNKTILSEYKANFNKYIKNNYFGISKLIGLEITNEDFYWCFESESGTKFKENCNCGLEWKID